MAKEAPKQKQTSSLFSLEDQFAFYGSYHTDPVNVSIHIVCVPLIFFTALILLHYFPHPSLGEVTLPYIANPLELTPSMLNALAYAIYFIILEPPAGLSYAPILIGMGHLSNVLYDADPSLAMKWAGIGFGGAWVAQFIGHGAFEGRAPALLTSLVQSLVLAVFFVYLEVLFKLGYDPELHRRVQSKIGVRVTEYRLEKARAKKAKDEARAKKQ